MKYLNKNERVEKIANRLNHNRDLSLSYFRDWMLKEFQLWEDFDYKDWIYILDKIKNRPHKLYVFFPFVYRILGIEILQEFESLKDVDEEVIKYVDKGKGLQFHSLRTSDLSVYQHYKDVIDKALEIRNKLILQGAKSNKGYILHLGEQINNYEKYRLYRRKIKREEFTNISIQDSKKSKYLFEERDLSQYKKK